MTIDMESDLILDLLGDNNQIPPQPNEIIPASPLSAETDITTDAANAAALAALPKVLEVRNVSEGPRFQRYIAQLKNLGVHIDLEAFQNAHQPTFHTPLRNIDYLDLQDRARQIWNTARKLELMPPFPCAICGRIKTHGHHYDYRLPLSVIWLCPTHHKMQHAGKVERQFLGQYPLVYPKNLKRILKLYTKALKTQAQSLVDLMEPRETMTERLDRILDIAEPGTEFTRMDFQAWGQKERIGQRTVDRWIRTCIEDGRLTKRGRTKGAFYQTSFLRTTSRTTSVDDLDSAPVLAAPQLDSTAVLRGDFDAELAHALRKVF
jgi:hypothetical protein